MVSASKSCATHPFSLIRVGPPSLTWTPLPDWQSGGHRQSTSSSTGNLKAEHVSVLLKDTKGISRLLEYQSLDGAKSRRIQKPKLDVEALLCVERIIHCKHFQFPEPKKSKRKLPRPISMGSQGHCSRGTFSLKNPRSSKHQSPAGSNDSEYSRNRSVHNSYTHKEKMEHDGTAVLQQAPVVNLFFPPSHSGMNSSNKYEENKETRLHCWTWLPGIAELCPSVELRRLGRSHSHLHHHDSFLVFLDSLFFSFCILLRPASGYAIIYMHL